MCKTPKPENINITWNDLVNICGSEEFLTTIIEVFLEEGRQALDKLQESIEKRDIKEIKLYSHRMKGSAKYLGDKEFIDVCLKAELAADEGNLEKAVKLAKQIEPITEKYLDFFARDDWQQLIKKQS